MALLHSFWYEEATRAFDDVIAADSTCAIAYWGRAMSFLHPLWTPPTKSDNEAGLAAAERAVRLARGGSREAGYAGAIATFYRDYQTIPFGPRLLAYEAAMRDIVEVMLKIDAQAYSFEAGNVRHEHEWAVWKDVKLPDDRHIVPGVVSHATNVVEYPELVAERIRRFTDLVGRERVIAATDCGLGGRVHPDIAWAKLEALAQGAAIASKQLWR